MGTDAARRCPVCSEPYDEPPAECFRCETRLSSWWPFEDAALRSQTQPPPGPRILPLAIAALLGTMVAAVALRVMTGTTHAPIATVAPPPPPSTLATAAATAPVAEPRESAPRPAVFRYRVQPGDSLWRVAAALTGDGRNWKTLWPSRPPEHPLAVGTMLEVPIR